MWCKNKNYDLTIKEYFQFIFYDIIWVLTMMEDKVRHNHTKPPDWMSKNFTTITCQCNVHPLITHFYIVKLGFTGVTLLFLLLFQNIGCGYLLEPPQRLTCTHNLCLEQNKE